MITLYELTARSYPEDWDLVDCPWRNWEWQDAPEMAQNQRVSGKVRPRLQVMGEMAADIQLRSADSGPGRVEEFNCPRISPISRPKLAAAKQMFFKD